MLAFTTLWSCSSSVPSPQKSGTGARTYNLTRSDSGRALDIRIGDKISIELDSNPTTGFSWSLTTKPSGAVLRQDLDAYSPTPVPSGIVGSGGRQLYAFTAIGAGSTSLKAEYFRAFEKSVPPAETFSLTVNVS